VNPYLNWRWRVLVFSSTPFDDRLSFLSDPPYPTAIFLTSPNSGLFPFFYESLHLWLTPCPQTALFSWLVECWSQHPQWRFVPSPGTTPSVCLVPQPKFPQRYLLRLGASTTPCFLAFTFEIINIVCRRCVVPPLSPQQWRYCVHAMVGTSHVSLPFGAPFPGHPHFFPLSRGH